MFARKQIIERTHQNWLAVWKLSKQPQINQRSVKGSGTQRTIEVHNRGTVDELRAPVTPLCKLCQLRSYRLAELKKIYHDIR